MDKISNQRFRSNLFSYEGTSHLDHEKINKNKLLPKQNKCYERTLASIIRKNLSKYQTNSQSWNIEVIDAQKVQK